MALNIGIFVAISLLTTVRVDIALGFGLFAILSIIRLRSSTVTQQEVAYYFVALVLGLVNGLDLADRRLVVLVNVLLLVTMPSSTAGRCASAPGGWTITLDTVHADDAALVADLERRLGGRVMHHEVNDDRLRARHDGRRRALPGRARGRSRRLRTSSSCEVTLDVVHADDAALVADLERRLGGQVLHHQVKDIDYVRDTMDRRRDATGWAAAEPASRRARQHVDGQPNKRLTTAATGCPVVAGAVDEPRPLRRPAAAGRPRPSGRWPRPPRWSSRSAWTS